MAQLYYNFINPQGLTLNNAEANVMRGSQLPTRNQKTASWILRESNKAFTTHCCSHNLNLSLASTCKLSVVDNVLEKYKSLQIYY